MAVKNMKQHENCWSFELLNMENYKSFANKTLFPFQIKQLLWEIVVSLRNTHWF